MQKYLIHSAESIYGSKGYVDEEIYGKYISSNPIYSLVKDEDEFHYPIEDYKYETREELEGLPDPSALPEGMTSDEEEAWIMEWMEDNDGPLVKPNDHLGGYDGYTNSTYSYVVTPVTDERAEEIELIIKAYESI